MTPLVREIGPGIWWVHVRRGYYRQGPQGQLAIGEPFVRVEFEGDIFQGPNAERLAREWRP